MTRCLCLLVLGVVVLGAAEPVITVPASATPSVITGKTSTLRVTATDDLDTAALIYTWSAPAGVTFSASNGTITGKTCTATFAASGAYTCTVTVQDTTGQTATSSVDVTVVPTLASLALTPSTTVVNVGASQAFTVLAKDQYGLALDPQPAIAWSATGDGSIDVTGLFTAGPASGSATITATAGTKSVSRTLRINTGPIIQSDVATTAPDPIDGRMAIFTAAGADDMPVDELLYTWSATSSTGKTVSFSPRRSILGEETTATFSGIGVYTITVVVSDKQGLTATSSLAVRVIATATSLTIAPTTAVVVNPGLTKPFVATVRDQFKAIMAPQPTVDWAVTAGSGSIGTDGIFLAGQPGPATVTATSGAATGSVTLRVNAAPTVASVVATDTPVISGTTAVFTVQGADDDNVDLLSYTWTASGPKAVAFVPKSGTNAETTTATFAAAGTYTITATIKDKQALSTTSSMVVTVVQTPTGYALYPASAVLNPKVAKVFAVQSRDQFNLAIGGAGIPATTWSATGGTVDAAGRYVAGLIPGLYAITAEVATEPVTTLTGDIRVNAAPTVATAPATTGPDPTLAATVPLTVLGADDGGEANLKYTWSAIGATGVTFSGATQNTTAARSITAAVPGPGTYTFRVLIRDAQGLSVTADTTVGVAFPAPIATPAGGTFASPVAVTLSKSQPDGEIRYTLDGSDPTLASPVAEGPIQIAQSLTMTARVFRAGWAPGEACIASYVISGGGDDGLPPAVPQVVLAIIGGLTGDGTATTPEGQLHFSNADSIQVQVTATPGQTGDTIAAVAVAGGGVEATGAAGEPLTITLPEGRHDLVATAVATRGGGSASGVSAPVAIQVRRSLRGVVWSVELPDAGGRQPLRCAATGDADVVYLNANPEAENVHLRTDRGWNAYGAAGFTVIASDPDGLGWSSAPQALTASAAPASGTAVDLVMAAQTDAAGPVARISGFANLPDSLAFAATTLQPSALKGAWLLTAHLTDRCGNAADVPAMRLWVDRDLPAARAGKLPVQRFAVTQPFAVAADGLVEVWPALWLVTTWDVAEAWQVVDGVRKPLRRQLATLPGLPTSTAGLPLAAWRVKLDQPGTLTVDLRDLAGNRLGAQPDGGQAVAYQRRNLPGPDATKPAAQAVPWRTTMEPPWFVYISTIPGQYGSSELERTFDVITNNTWTGDVNYADRDAPPGLVGRPLPPAPSLQTLDLPQLPSEELCGGSVLYGLGYQNLEYRGGVLHGVTRASGKQVVADQTYVDLYTKWPPGWESMYPPMPILPPHAVGQTISTSEPSVWKAAPGSSNGQQVVPNATGAFTLTPRILNVPPSWADGAQAVTVRIDDGLAHRRVVDPDLPSQTEVTGMWKHWQTRGTVDATVGGYPSSTYGNSIDFEHMLLTHSFPSRRIDQGRQARIGCGLAPTSAGGLDQQVEVPVAGSETSLTGSLPIARGAASPGLFRVAYEDLGPVLAGRRVPQKTYHQNPNYAYAGQYFGSTYDYLTVTPTEADTVYRDLPPQNTSWWDATGFRQGSLLQVMDDVVVAGSRATVRIRGGFLTDGQDIDTLGSIAPQLGFYDAARHAETLTRLAPGRAGVEAAVAQAAAAVASAEAEVVRIAGLQAEGNGRVGAIQAIAGPYADPLMTELLAQQAVYQSQQNDLENQLSGLRASKRQAIRAAVTAYAGMAASELADFQAQLAASQDPQAQADLTRWIAIAQARSTAVQTVGQSLSQQPDNQALHDGSYATAMAGWTAYADDIARVDVAIASARLLAAGANASLCQELALELDIPSSARVGIYHLDVKFGAVHAYPDELSQQYAGANGAHRMKEALAVVKMEFFSPDSNSINGSIDYSEKRDVAQFGFPSIGNGRINTMNSWYGQSGSPSDVTSSINMESSLIMSIPKGDNVIPTIELFAGISGVDALTLNKVDSNEYATDDGRIVVTMNSYGSSDATVLDYVVFEIYDNMQVYSGSYRLVETDVDSWCFTNINYGSSKAEGVPVLNELPKNKIDCDDQIGLLQNCLKIQITGPPTVMSSFDQSIIVKGRASDGRVQQSEEIPVTTVGSDSIITNVPIMLLRGGISQLPSSVAARLPSDLVVIDPDSVDVIGGLLNQAIVYTQKTNHPELHLGTTSDPLFIHNPITSPSYYQLEVSPGEKVVLPSDNLRLFFKIDEDDSPLAIQFKVKQQDGSDFNVSEWQFEWYLRVRFQAGDAAIGRGKVFRIDEWHKLSSETSEVDFNASLTPTVDGMGGIGVGDYDIFARMTTGHAPNKTTVESNLIHFKVLGKNPGQTRIFNYIETLPNPAIIGTDLTQLFRWYKAIVTKESEAGSYAFRNDFDQFENAPETHGLDIGFERSLRYRDVRYNWDARYGFAFASVDNGYGIAQITDPQPDYRTICRWKNTVRYGWNLLRNEKIPAAIVWLRGRSGLPLNQIPSDIIIKEAVRMYNSGHEYVYQNNNFVSQPSRTSNPGYLDEVRARLPAE